MSTPLPADDAIAVPESVAVYEYQTGDCGASFAPTAAVKGSSQVSPGSGPYKQVPLLIVAVAS